MAPIPFSRQPLALEILRENLSVLQLLLLYNALVDCHWTVIELAGFTCHTEHNVACLVLVKVIV